MLYNGELMKSLFAEVNESLSSFDNDENLE